MRLKELFEYLDPIEEVGNYFGYSLYGTEKLLEKYGDNIVKIYHNDKKHHFLIYYSYHTDRYPLAVFKSQKNHYYKTIKKLNISQSVHLSLGEDMMNFITSADIDFYHFLSDNRFALIDIEKNSQNDFIIHPINPYTTKAINEEYVIAHNTYEKLYNFIKDLYKEQHDIITIYEGETKNMAICTNNYSDYADNKKDLGLNFEFGPCTGSNIRMSLYGIAVKNNSGNYVSYDKKTGNVVDVDIINIKGDKYFWKVPVAIKDIKVGDTVIHNRVPMFVESVTNGDIKAIDIAAAEKKEIIPVTNVFGFNFVTKVVSLFDAFGGNVNASADNPFGNMLPFLLMNGDSSGNEMLPLLMMTNPNMAQNPLMLMALMGDGASDNLLMALALSGGNSPFTAFADSTVNKS